MRRDCKPAKGLSKSYCQGACAIPLSAQTIGNVLFSKEIDPDMTLFTSPEYNQRMTIKELQGKAVLFSKWLLQNDIKKGDVVMVTGVANLYYLPVLLGAVSVGCICQTVTTSHFRQNLIQQINPSVIVVGHQIEKEAYAYAEKLKNNQVSDRPSNLKLIDIWGNNNEGQEYLSDDSSITDDQYDSAVGLVSPEDPAIILRTTGSTGSSKAVLLSHKTLVNLGTFCVDRSMACDEEHQKDIVAVPNPVTDDVQAPLISVQILVNWKSKRCVFCPTWLDYGCEDIERFAIFLQDEKITSYRGYTYEIVKLVNSELINLYDISKLTLVNMVAQAVSKSMREKIFQYFPKSMVIYGASECLVGTATSSSLSSQEQLMNSIGYPFPHTEIKIVGNGGELLPIRTPGEICIKGFGVFSGYLYNESETCPVDNNGWLHTGDIGEMDDTGHIVFIGRKGDHMTFKHGGDKIYPKHITDVASSHPNIFESAVVGLQSDENGDDIFLFCVLKDESKDSPNSLKDFMVQNAPHEIVIPDYIVPVKCLPRIGARNKVDSRALVAIATEVRQAAQAS